MSLLQCRSRDYWASLNAEASWAEWVNQHRSMRARGMITCRVVSDDVAENIVVPSQWGRQGVLAGVLVARRGGLCVQSRGLHG